MAVPRPPLPRLSRRAVLRRALVAGGAVALAPAIGGCAGRGGRDERRWAGRFLTIATPGGALRQGLYAAAFDPFARATGCRVMDVVLPVGELVAELRRQTRAGRVEWDLVALDAPRLATLLRDEPRPFAPLADAARDPRATLPGDLRPFAVPLLTDTLALACRVGPFGGRAPQTWAEAWDTAAFPGPRHFPRDPVGLLEVALLSDGVPSARLYPLDLDHAFRALDRLRPAIRAWWTVAESAGEALTLGEADLVLARGGDLRAALDSGAVAALAPLPLPGLAVALAGPAGAPNGDVARDFVAHALGTATQAALTDLGYQPILGSGAPDPAAALDLAWWGESGRDAIERFERWVAA